MSPFFEKIIFIVITLIVNIFVWIILYQRKIEDDNSYFEDKKRELLNLVEDADEMIQELNNLSDYICTRIDQKNNTLNKAIDELKMYLEKFEKLHQESLFNTTTLFTDTNNVVYDSLKVIEKDGSQKIQTNMDLHAFNVMDNKKISDENIDKVENNRKHLNKTTLTSQKYKKILNLAEKGLSSIEIAKNLNMGRGEVQLILDTRK